MDSQDTLIEDGQPEQPIQTDAGRSGGCGAPLRLRGRYYFLTYPRCERLPFELAAHLENIGMSGAIIAREEHASGDHHLHAAVDFGKRKQFSDAIKSFDFPCPESNKVYHGNYQVARSWRSVCDYACKGDDVQLFGTARFPEEQQVFEESCALLPTKASSCSYRDFLVWSCTARIPYGYATDIWRSVNEAVPTTLEDSFHDGNMIPFFHFLRFDPVSRQCLVVQGDSGIGKTTWAKINIPKPALMCSEIDDLKHFRAGYHVAILFDDMHFNGNAEGKGAWPRTSQIHIVDMENDRSIRCRHRNALIPKGVYRIFTCNSFPFVDDPAIHRRIQYIQAW